MEPITHFTDYPSLYPDAITKESIKKELEKFYIKSIREKLGGNMEIHRPNDMEVFGNGISLRSA